MSKLLSRPLAVAAALVAVVFAVLAVRSRMTAPSDDESASCPLRAGEPGSGSAAGATAARGAAPAAPAAAAPTAPAQLAASTADPELGAVVATVITAERGIDITLAMAMRLPADLPPRSAIWLRAQCAVAGEWYDGTARISLDDLGRGEHVVAHVVVGRSYRLGALPTACHLAFQRDLLSLSRATDAFAIRCWNGTAVVDGRCPPVPRLVDGVPIAAVRGMTVRGDADLAGATPPRHLDVEVEAELARAVDWRGRITAECTLPDGTAWSDTGSIGLRYRPGAPFFATAMLFTSHRLPARPTRCTLRVALVDDYDLATEPLAVRCWSGGATRPGPCAP